MKSKTAVRYLDFVCVARGENDWRVRDSAWDGRGQGYSVEAAHVNGWDMTRRQNSLIACNFNWVPVSAERWALRLEATHCCVRPTKPQKKVIRVDRSFGATLQRCTLRYK